MTRRPHRLSAGTIAVAIGLTVLVGRAHGAGFLIQEQSGRALGNAFVGEAAAAEDASTIWFNPAGLTRLHGTQLVGSSAFIWPHGTFEDHGSHLSPAVGGGHLLGDEGGNGLGWGLVPAGYIAHELSDRWRIGLGLNAPFGLVTDWNRTWVGRYHALHSELKTIDMAPTVAVRIAPQLSLGVGLDVQYAHAKLSNALDMGSICAENAARLGVPAAFCGALGLTPQSHDGNVTIRGDSWGVGGNAGALWEPTSRTRVGFAYRSRIDHTLNGDAHFVVPKQAKVLQTTSGALVDTAGKAALNLPDQARIDVFQQLTDRWSVQTGVQWTHWARFKELRFSFSNPKQPTVVDPQNWDDSFRTGIATLYRLAPNWLVRFGFAYDFTPVPGPADRSPRVPDSDRIWLSGGLGYRLTKHITVDAAYAHLFAQTGSSNRRDPITGHVLVGRYTADANIFGGQLAWQF